MGLCGSKSVSHCNWTPDRIWSTEFMEHEEGSVSHSKLNLVYSYYVQVNFRITISLKATFPLRLDSHWRARALLFSSLIYTQHTRHKSSGRAISPTQRPPHDNTHHSQEANIHVPGGIRNRNPSNQAASDPRLRPRGYWDRPKNYINC
jgi:hypothetical protein